MTRPITSDGAANLGVAVDPRRASPARVWSYLLGEKDHFAADREVADLMTAALPGLPATVRADRRFVFRAVWHLVAELGIRQFLDIGAGLPCVVNLNLHEIAQDIDPAVRVVYLDNDPLVAAHCRALHISSRAGRVAFLAADAADPSAILNDPALTGTLDLSQPVALTLVSVLMHFPDALAHNIVSTLLAGLPPGSCAVISHHAADLDASAAVAEANAVAKQAGITYVPRTRACVTRLFTGLDLVAPGVVSPLAWTPGGTGALDGRKSRAFSRRSTRVSSWVGVGRKRCLTDT